MNPPEFTWTRARYRARKAAREFAASVRPSQEAQKITLPPMEHEWDEDTAAIDEALDRTD